jgi:hypothetical protein
VLAASLALIAAAIAPASAGAVTVSVTGDDGNPVALGGPVNMRNMNPQLTIASAASDRFTLTVAGPTGAKVASDVSCVRGLSLNGKFVDYVGNGVYTVTVTAFASGDTSCTTPLATQTLPFTITASTALGAPTGPVLTRKAGSVIPNTISLPIDPNPGALGTDVFVERNVTPNPDGSLPGTPEQLYPNTAARTVDVRLDKGPGLYVVAAHAKGYAGVLNPQAFGPWATPVTIRAFAPFDTQKFTWTDTRGPSYRFSAVVRATGATGTVSIGIRRGSKGKFRSYGKVKIRKHRFSKRIRLPRTGKYQLRLGYKGNSTVAPGSEVRSFRITRRITFARSAALVG